MIWNIKWNNNYKTFSSLVKSLVRTGKYHCSLIISGSLPLPWFCCCLVAKLCPAATAAAAKLLQSCPTLCDPIDGGPPGSPVPGILQARTLEWVAISFSNAWKWKVKVKSLSRAWLLATPWTAAHQAPSSMGFSRQEYWSGVPLPSPKLCPTLLQLHGSQARILEWIALSFFRWSSWPRYRTCVSCIDRWILYHWTTWEALYLIY